MVKAKSRRPLKGEVQVGLWIRKPARMGCRLRVVLGAVGALILEYRAGLQKSCSTKSRLEFVSRIMKLTVHEKPTLPASVPSTTPDCRSAQSLPIQSSCHQVLAHCSQVSTPLHAALDVQILQCLFVMSSQFVRSYAE